MGLSLIFRCAWTVFIRTEIMGIFSRTLKKMITGGTVNEVANVGWNLEVQHATMMKRTLSNRNEVCVG